MEDILPAEAVVAAADTHQVAEVAEEVEDTPVVEAAEAEAVLPEEAEEPADKKNKVADGHLILC